METAMYAYLENERPRLVPALFDSWLDPARAAVVSIDMQGGYLDVDDPRCTCPCPRAVPKIGAHDEFHAACRAVGIPIIHCELALRPGGIDNGALLDPPGGPNYHWLRFLYPDPNPHADRHGWEGTTSSELRLDAPLSDYHVRPKKRLSCFYATDLEFLLKQLGTRTICVTGIYTEACVLSTVFAATDMDYRIIVPRDIVAGHSAETEHFALKLISLWYGLVVDSGAVLAEWYARAGADMPQLTELARAAPPVAEAPAVAPV